MSLATCLAKFGDAVSTDDRARLAQHIRDGMNETQALETLLREAREHKAEIVASIEEAGGTVRSATRPVAPPDPPRVAQVRRWLAPVLKALEPIARASVVETTAELPDPNAPPDVEGVYTQDGEVYFVAANIPNAARALEVGRHEVFGHMAIERNGNFKARLDAVQRAIRAGNFKPLVREVRARQGLLPAAVEAREVVALMAERGVKSPLLASFRSALREVGRDLGLDMPVDEAELTALVGVAARDLKRDAALMRDFRAAQGLPAVQALQKADPTEAEILAAIDAIYDSDALDHDWRRAPSGKRVRPGMYQRTIELNRKRYPINDSTGKLIAGTAEEQRNFWRWFGRSKVVDADGKPLVVYHGTTGDFEVFDPDKASFESDLGGGLYFTSERRDVRHNYAGFGPDLTARFERRVEEIQGAVEWDDDLRAKLEAIAGGPAEQLPGPKYQAAIQQMAREQLASQNEGFTMPVYLRIENPLVMGKSVHEGGLPETVLEMTEEVDEEGEPTGAEPEGQLWQFIERLRRADESFHDGNSEGLVVKLLEEGMDGGIRASRIYELAAADESFQYFTDDNGNLAANEILRQAFEEAGFDGIVDYTVDKKFGSQRRIGRSMKGMDEDTVHYVAFRPEQVKSAVGNSGAFDPESPSILMSRAAALPGAVPNDIQALLERVMAPRESDMSLLDRARTTWRKLTDFNADAIRQGVIDSFDAVKQLEKGQLGALMDAAESPYKAALATRNLPSVMAAVMLRGVPVYKQGAFQLETGRKGVIEIFRPLTEHPDGNLLPLWELYAAAKRAKQLKKQGRERLFSDADITKALALAEQYPLLEEVAKEWETFNGQLLDLAVERGVLDPAAVKLWKANFYVPFYRAMEEAAAGGEGPKAKRGLEGHGGAAVKKRLKGGEEKLGDVFANMLMNTAYLIDESFKNTAMQKIAAIGEGVAMEKIPLKWDAVQLPAGQLEKALDQLGGMVLGFKDDPTSPTGKSWQPGLEQSDREEWLKLFRRVAPVGKDVVAVYEGGKPVYYRVTDDLLLRSISNMGFDNFSDVFGLFRGSKRLLTGAITLDPAFMMANWVRDTLSTWVTSDAGIVPVIDALKGVKAALAMDSEILEMMAAGAGGGGIYDMQPTELRTFLVDKLGSKSAADKFMGTIVSPKNWLRAWRRIGNAAENANRVAVYKAVRAAGGSVAEAAYQARDVLNFTMSGDYAAMRWLTATVPFMNARIQGLYRLWRGAQDHPLGFAMKGLALTAATLALLLKNNDDEEYEQLPEWDRDMYWHFFVGGEHYRLPKPFEVGAIFGTIPERMFRLGTGRDSADIAKERVMAMLGETFAFNPIPQLAKPLIEQYANKSFFTGSPIVGLSELNLEPEAQYTPWTSETMKLMAEAMPDFAPAWLRSPRRLEALMRAYLGATGTYALQAADTLAREASGAPPRPARKIYDMPVVKRFMQDPNPRYTKYADQLYTMLEEANSIFRTVNRYREEGRLDDARALIEENRGKLAARTRLNRVATRVRALNNQIQLTLYSPTMTPEAKRARLDELTARKNEVTARVAPLTDLF